MKLDVFIPGPVVGLNQSYAVGRSGSGKGQFYKTAVAKKWQADAALLIGAKAGEIGWEDHGGEFSVEITIFQDPHDVDASVKLAIDALAQKLGFDDKRVRKQSSLRVDEGERGMRIVLEEL